MPRGSERPKSSARIHGSLVRFIAMVAIPHPGRADISAASAARATEYAMRRH